MVRQTSKGKVAPTFQDEIVCPRVFPKQDSFKDLPRLAATLSEPAGVGFRQHTCADRQALLAANERN
jgi:hypothetical protein